MSGWLVLRNLDGAPVDLEVWRAALSRIRERHDSLDQVCNGACALGAWRRQSGEFSASGRVHSVSPDKNARVAWIGQCVDDGGDATDEALRLTPSISADAASKALALNGAFAAACLDERQERITIVSSRFAHYPVYVYRSRDLWAASTAIECLIPLIGSPRIDPAAVNLILRSGELVDRMTLVEGVEALPGAIVLQVDEDGVREEIYWRYRTEHDAAISRRTAVNELADAFVKGVRRIEKATERKVIPLSGGLDSRLILASCERPEEIPSFTFGPDSCRDARFAARLAERLGSPHSGLDFPVDAYPDLWDDAVMASAGCFGLRDMFILPFVDLLAERGDVALNGLLGGGALGGEYQQKSWRQAPNLETLATATWSWRSRSNERELIDALMPDGRSSLEAEAMWRNSVTADRSGRPMERLNDWIVISRNSRYVNHGSSFLRLRLESHSPFLDSDFVDVLLKTPLEWRYLHRLYIDVLKRVSWSAASVPWDRTCVPPAWGNAAVLGALGVQKIIRLAMSRLGKQAFSGALYADPAIWIRDEWKAPLHSILFSDESRHAGVFNPEGVEAIWRDHMDRGADHSRTLGIMAAIEILRKNAFDASTSRPRAETDAISSTVGS